MNTQLHSQDSQETLQYLESCQVCGGTEHLGKGLEHAALCRLGQRSPVVRFLPAEAPFKPTHYLQGSNSTSDADPDDANSGLPAVFGDR